MRDDETIDANLVEETWMTLEQVASACAVEPAWLLQHINEGLFPQAESVAGVWRISTIGLTRACRMVQLERDFDAVPELAALMADMLEEMDELRARLRRAGMG